MYAMENPFTKEVLWDHDLYEIVQLMGDTKPLHMALLDHKKGDRTQVLYSSRLHNLIAQNLHRLQTRKDVFDFVSKHGYIEVAPSIDNEGNLKYTPKIVGRLSAKDLKLELELFKAYFRTVDTNLKDARQRYGYPYPLKKSDASDPAPMTPETV